MIAWIQTPHANSLESQFTLSVPPGVSFHVDSGILSMTVGITESHSILYMYSNDSLSLTSYNQWQPGFRLPFDSQEMHITLSLTAGSKTPHWGTFHNIVIAWSPTTYWQSVFVLYISSERQDSDSWRFGVALMIGDESLVSDFPHWQSEALLYIAWERLEWHRTLPVTYSVSLHILSDKLEYDSTLAVKSRSSHVQWMRRCQPYR